MKTFRFKTNINCGGCVEKVKPHLDAEEDIKDWSVDITSPHKFLTVKTESLKPKDIIKIVRSTGFHAEEKPEGFLSKIFS